MEFHENDESSMQEFRLAYAFAIRNRPRASDPVTLFKQFWEQNYSYIALTLSDQEIMNFIKSQPTLARAADQASDYLLASGEADVQE